MSDLEKVIRGLECCLHVKDCNCGDCPYDDIDLRCKSENLYNDVMELLKAQEPVNPFVTGNGQTFEEAETWWYACGNCNKPIDPNDQYCRHCGRELKWDG